MFCSTPSALDDYMDKKAIEGGNITRTVLCQLDDQIGADGAIFKEYSSEQLRTIQNTLGKMLADTYTSEGALMPELNLDMSWLDKDVRKWCTTKGKQALESGSVALDVFRKRSSVSAFRIASLCYYLYSLETGSNGLKSSNSLKGEDTLQTSQTLQTSESIARKRARRIYLFMADYILSMLQKRWGKRFEELQQKRNEEEVTTTNRPRLLDHLAQVFTRDQLRALMQKLNVTSPDRVLLSQWKSNHWIEQLDKNQFKKLV